MNAITKSLKKKLNKLVGKQFSPVHFTNNYKETHLIQIKIEIKM